MEKTYQYEDIVSSLSQVYSRKENDVILEKVIDNNVDIVDYITTLKDSKRNFVDVINQGGALEEFLTKRVNDILRYNLLLNLKIDSYKKDFYNLLEMFSNYPDKLILLKKYIFNILNFYREYVPDSSYNCLTIPLPYYTRRDNYLILNNSITTFNSSSPVYTILTNFLSNSKLLDKYGYVYFNSNKNPYSLLDNVCLYKSIDNNNNDTYTLITKVGI